MNHEDHENQPNRRKITKKNNPDLRGLMATFRLFRELRG